MKKLSELSNDTMLTVSPGFGVDFEVIEKEDILNDPDYIEYIKSPGVNLTVGDKVVARFDLCTIIDQIGEDEMYEDWFGDVWYNIKKSGLDIKKLNETINTIFNENPIYYEGEEVEIDVVQP